MKRWITFAMAAVMLFTLTACGRQNIEPEIEGTRITLSDEAITVDGTAAATEETAAVYVGHDIVYYHAGQDLTYGEGTAEDAHDAAEADGHTVVHITQPGTYVLSGTLSAGQIAVDLGEDAETDPAAVVTLVLDGVDITSTVAPGIIFYRVYECDTAETASMEVDTSAAGANIVLAEGTENTVNGSYVARIYKSCTLSEDGTEVVESKKLHKYDGAVYSRMSMNVSGDGALNINAENEGLDTERHLTVNSGRINIISGNDGINTNEDGVSVTTINGGEVQITVSGSTGEGDGIDSNGWLVINGGCVTAWACATSGDSGIDADNGVYINGGTVIAGGNMLDPLEGEQNYAVFRFAAQQTAGQTYTLKNAAGDTVLSAQPVNGFSYLVLSYPELTEGEYTLWRGEEQLSGTEEAGMGQRPEQGAAPEMPEGMEAPPQAPNGAMPEPPEGQPGDMTPPEKPDGERPDGAPADAMQPPQMPDGMPNAPGERADGEVSEIFNIVSGGNRFVIA